MSIMHCWKHAFDVGMMGGVHKGCNWLPLATASKHAMATCSALHDYALPR